MTRAGLDVSGAADPTRLPAPYDRWVRQMLGRVPAAESRATCHDCAMCAKPDTPTVAQRIVFDPLTRCCTYQPHLPNFLAGGVLASTDDESAFGRATLQRRMESGNATLLGVRIDPAYQFLYREANEQAFGRARSLRCPHHRDDGGCGIWAHRPAVCATWFCKHERGAVGRRLWMDLYRTLVAVERVVSLWCLRQMGVPAESQRAAMAALDHGPALDASSLDNNPDPDHQQHLWGDWQGREAEFYIACAAQVDSLGWGDVLTLGGIEVALMVDSVRQSAMAADDLSLPPRLHAGAFAVCGGAAGQLWLQGYSEFDPLAVGAEVLALVARCDGRDREVILAEHAAVHGQRPSRMLLRTLLDAGILQPD